MDDGQIHQCATSEVKQDLDNLRKEFNKLKGEHEQEKRKREQAKKECERDEKVLLEYEIYNRIAQGTRPSSLVLTHS